MSDLTAFLRARIGEDEAWANAALLRRFAPIPQAMERPDTVERVLADVQAKRAIVEDRAHLDTLRPGAVRAHSEWVCRVLAAVYADHPDYREEWRP